MRYGYRRRTRCSNVTAGNSAQIKPIGSTAKNAYSYGPNCQAAARWWGATEQRIRPQASNEVWGLDFVSDQLADGSGFRALTVVDIFSREALAIEVGQRMGGEHVVEVLNRLAAQRRAPSTCRSTTELNLRVGCWTYGRTTIELRSTSIAGKAHRQLLCVAAGCNLPESVV